MESTHWFSTVCIYLNWSIVYLWHCLKFYVISPDSILSFPLNVLVKEVLPSNDKLDEEISLILNVVEASLPNQIMMRLVSIVNLVRNSSEQAIPIPFNLIDLEILHSKHSPEHILLFLDLFHLLSYLFWLTALLLKAHIVFFYVHLMRHISFKQEGFVIKPCLAVGFWIESNLSKLVIQHRVKLICVVRYELIPLTRPSLKVNFDMLIWQDLYYKCLIPLSLNILYIDSVVQLQWFSSPPLLNKSWRLVFYPFVILVWPSSEVHFKHVPLFLYRINWIVLQLLSQHCTTCSRCRDSQYAPLAVTSLHC